MKEFTSDDEGRFRKNDPRANAWDDSTDAGASAPEPDSAVAEATSDDAASGDGVLSEIETLRREVAEQRDKYLRLAAEFDNFRRRSTKERQEAGTRAQGDLVKQIVDALDDLSRFSQLDPATSDSATVIQGVDMVEKKLLKGLTSAGLEVIDPLGEPFDPAKHEALATEPAASPEEDQTVARVYQRGYLFGPQLLRPARVVVKQWS